MSRSLRRQASPLLDSSASTSSRCLDLPVVQVEGLQAVSSVYGIDDTFRVIEESISAALAVPWGQRRHGLSNAFAVKTEPIVSDQTQVPSDNVTVKLEDLLLDDRAVVDETFGLYEIDAWPSNDVIEVGVDGEFSEAEWITDDPRFDMQV